MIINRWQAPQVPDRSQIMLILDGEGLEGKTEVYDANEKVSEHRHPFYEIRMVISGEMMFNIAGNQFLLRSGDRVEVPPNTRHWFATHGQAPCESICAIRLA